MPIKQRDAWTALCLVGVIPATLVLSNPWIDGTPEFVQRQRLTALAHAIDQYTADVGALPGELPDLLGSRERGWQGPYAHGSLLRDRDGVDVTYSIVDPAAAEYRIDIPAHIAKSGLRVFKVSLDRTARAANLRTDSDALGRSNG
ncbi:MAG TPA: hypothetical protein VKB52_07560 [Rhodanobacteraceae bacterium]|nr:hypothetical protein [Rhodanobacteraceae bacterium]